jgi:hypothetical protein
MKPVNRTSDEPVEAGVDSVTALSASASEEPVGEPGQAQYICSKELLPEVRVE